MSEPLASRHEQMLGEFAEWLHASAREAHQRLMASESAEEFTAYNNALHKLGRNLRQTLALHKRFADDRLEVEADAQAEADEARQESRRWKRSRLRHAMERMVWDEHERDDHEDGPGERLLEDIELRLASLSTDPGFFETDDEVVIARLCQEFGFDVPPHIVQALAMVAKADAPRPNGHSGPAPDSS